MKRRLGWLMAAGVGIALIWLAVRELVVPGPEAVTAAPRALVAPPEECTLGPTVIDDVSELNPAEVGVVCRPTTEDSFRSALAYARESRLTVSVAAQRHSQGGHVSSPGGLVIDTTAWRGVEVGDDGIATARSGSSWADVQAAANPRGLAVRVMQSSNIFSVGGSLSVNCHGRDKDFGPIRSTVQSFRLLLADGTVVTVGPSDPRFDAVIGGYGLLGVILDVRLTLRPNVTVTKSVTTHHHRSYVEHLAPVVADPDVQLHFGRLNIDDLDAANYLRAMYSVEHIASGPASAAPLSIDDPSSAKVVGRVMELGEWSSLAKKARWKLLLDQIDVPGSVETMTLNNAMRPPVSFLFERSGTTTVNILQEYFLPPDGFAPFIDRLREVATEHDVDLQNVTTRWVASGDRAALSYAPGERIAVVLYINLLLTDDGIASGERWTRELVDHALDAGGSYYLAYQRWPSQGQVQRAYPHWDAFAALKREHDPDGLFGNQFWQQYGPATP